jgi:hypothetical protein
MVEEDHRNGNATQPVEAYLPVRAAAGHREAQREALPAAVITSRYNSAVLATMACNVNLAAV